MDRLAPRPPGGGTGAGAVDALGAAAAAAAAAGGLHNAPFPYALPQHYELDQVSTKVARDFEDDHRMTLSMHSLLGCRCVLLLDSWGVFRDVSDERKEGSEVLFRIFRSAASVESLGRLAPTPVVSSCTRLMMSDVRMRRPHPRLQHIFCP